MFKRIIATSVVTAAAALGPIAPAMAMHDGPAPVDDVAPESSGHYSTPDIGSKGASRPWEAGPVWNR